LFVQDPPVPSLNNDLLYTVDTPEAYVVRNDDWTRRWTAVANECAAEAVRRASGDNVTVMIIALGDWYLHL
jgi:serine/threonine protein phosphatase PrpC